MSDAVILKKPHDIVETYVESILNKLEIPRSEQNISILRIELYSLGLDISNSVIHHLTKKTEKKVEPTKEVKK